MDNIFKLSHFARKSGAGVRCGSRKSPILLWVFKPLGVTERASLVICGAAGAEGGTQRHPFLPPSRQNEACSVLFTGQWADSGNSTRAYKNI